MRELTLVAALTGACDPSRVRPPAAAPSLRSRRSLCYGPAGDPVTRLFLRELRMFACNHLLQPEIEAVFPTQAQLMTTTEKGDIAEQAVVLALMAAGKTVLKPISNGLRYDVIVDNLDGTFTRVQCKTGMLKRGATVLSFRAYNADARRPGGVPYQGQVDAFGVYCPQDGRVYFVPMAAVGSITSEVSLRLSAPKNGQEQGIRCAATYRIGGSSA